MQTQEITHGNKKSYIKSNSIDNCFYVTVVMNSDISDFGDVLESNKVFKTKEKAINWANQRMA